MNNKLRFFCRAVLVLGKWVYLIAACFFVIGIMISIFRLHVEGFSDQNIITVFSLVAGAILYYLTFRFFFHVATAYEFWLKEHLNNVLFVTNLKKAAKALFFVATIDAIAILRKFPFQSDIGSKLQSHESDIFMRVLNLSEYYQSVMYEVLSYMAPRPSGLLAILIACFLTQIARQNKEAHAAEYI